MYKVSELKSFLTGSMAYGEPGPNSDIDLVVLVTPEHLAVLRGVDRQVSKQAEDDYPGEEAMTGCLRFGSLNLICCTTVQQFMVWKAGTEALVERKALTGKPVTREEAVKHFRALRAESKELYKHNP